MRALFLKGIVGIVALGGCVALFYLYWDWVVDNGALASGLLMSFVLLVAFVAAALQVSSMRHERAIAIATYLSQAYDAGTIFEGRKVLHYIENEQTTMEIEDTVSSFVETIEYYKVNHLDEYMKLTSIPGFFDLIGWLVRNGCCEARAIDEQLDWETHFRKWGPYIWKYQQEHGKKQVEKTNLRFDDRPTAFYGNFVWLANKINKKVTIEVVTSLASQ